MTYALSRDEPFGPGLRRVVLEETAAAVQGLERAGESDWEEVVHEARKSLKKSRAVLRLVRPSLGPLYGEANTLLRDGGRSLSVVRDARVLVTTVDQLAETSPDTATPDLVGPVREKLQERCARIAEKARAEGLAKAASERIRRAAGLLARGPWEPRGWEFIEAGLRREYRRGRSALAAARSDTSGEAVHEWRKRVKDHWYHLRLLRKGWPKVLKRTEKDAHALSDLLGDEHDLVVFNETLKAETGTMWEEERADALRAMADRRREELLAESFPLGRRLYAEKPARFTTRIGRYWEATRSEAGARKEPAAQAAGA